MAHGGMGGGRGRAPSRGEGGVGGGGGCPPAETTRQHLGVPDGLPYIPQADQGVPQDDRYIEHGWHGQDVVLVLEEPRAAHVDVLGLRLLLDSGVCSEIKARTREVGRFLPMGVEPQLGIQVSANMATSRLTRTTLPVRQYTQITTAVMIL